MVFSDEDNILIKKLYQLMGYNGRELSTEFPDKGWTLSSNKMLLKKFADSGTVDRRQSSDRPPSARTDENIDQVNDMVLTSESRGPARTHSTVREISWKTGIPKSSVVRVIRKDQQLKCFNRQRTQQLTEANCTAHKLLLKKFFQFAVDHIFFTDQKVFIVASAAKE